MSKPESTDESVGALEVVTEVTAEVALALGTADTVCPPPGPPKDGQDGPCPNSGTGPHS